MEKIPDIEKLISFKKLYAKGIQKKAELEKLPSSQAIFISAINQKVFTSQQQLSEFLGCNKAHTSRTLAKLEEKKLIEPLSTRNSPIKLTEKGRKLAEASINIKDCFAKSLTKGLTKDELQIFEKVLDKILNNARLIIEGV